MNVTPGPCGRTITLRSCRGRCRALRARCARVRQAARCGGNIPCLRRALSMSRQSGWLRHWRKASSIACASVWPICALSSPIAPPVFLFWCVARLLCALRNRRLFFRPGELLLLPRAIFHNAQEMSRALSARSAFFCFFYGWVGSIYKNPNRMFEVHSQLPVILRFSRLKSRRPHEGERRRELVARIVLQDA